MTRVASIQRTLETLVFLISTNNEYEDVYYFNRQQRGLVPGRDLFVIMNPPEWALTTTTRTGLNAAHCITATRRNTLQGATLSQLLLSIRRHPLICTLRAVQPPVESLHV